MLRPVIASLVAGLGMPLLAVVALSVYLGRWSDLALYDLRIAYLILGPFTLAGAFLVAWPSYVLQRTDRPELAKIGVGLAVCGIVGAAMVLPFSDRLPWEGAAFGAATFLIWLAIYRLGRVPVHDINEVRSKPSG
jgi:uncharacterized membrane protein YfcA